MIFNIIFLIKTLIMKLFVFMILKIILNKNINLLNYFESDDLKKTKKIFKIQLIFFIDNQKID